jgi:hypothetical protein
LLDGVALGMVDFYSAAAAPAKMLWQQMNISLGIHRVSLQPLNTKNAASTGMTVVWDALKVMR